MKTIHPQMRDMIGERASLILDKHQIGQNGVGFGFGMKEGVERVTVRTDVMTYECLEELQTCFDKPLVWEKL